MTPDYAALVSELREITRREESQFGEPPDPEYILTRERPAMIPTTFQTTRLTILSRRAGPSGLSKPKPSFLSSRRERGNG